VLISFYFNIGVVDLRYFLAKPFSLAPFTQIKKAKKDTQVETPTAI